MEQWRGLPWWQADLYVEGLTWEFTPRQATDDSDDETEWVRTETGEQAKVVPLESMGVAWG